MYLDFRKSFDTVSFNICREKLMDGLDEQAGRWIENCLNSRAQRMVISGTKSLGGQ